MSDPAYTVYGTTKSRALRAVWMLEELEQPYAHQPCPPHADEIRAVNPTGKIPALGVDDDIVLDSVAIVQFLADRHQQFTHPAGTLARAHQDSFTQFCVDEVEGALWTAGKHSFVLPKERRVTEVKETARWEFDTAMTRLAQRLDGRDFVTGDMFTVPDLLLGQCALWARSAKFEIPQEGPVADYFARLLARPALKRALARS